METGLTPARPGGEIDSWCGKCKLVLAHTIEAMVGSKPARVSCNTCRSQHSYKANPPGSRTTKREGAPVTRSRRSSANLYQSLVKGAESTVIRNYSPKDNYQSGDVLDHPTFGRGAVMTVKDATKIEVLFENGTKTLVHAR
jgi:hypothetical protein